VRLLFLTCLFVILILRFASTRPIYKQGQTIRVTATIYTEPNIYESSLGIEVAGLRVYLPRFPEVEYWDSIVIEGQVKDGQLINPKIISITKSNLVLARLRKRFINFVKISLVEPHASLVSGIVLGSKSSMPKEFWDKLIKSSTAHVVVASGMNVTMLAGFLLNSLILFIRRKRAVIISLIGIWLYSLLSGFDAPIVRASIMGTIAFSALALGKLSNAIYALLLSAALMLLVNPSWIMNLGFVLSFVATLSLILFQAKVDRKIHFVPAILREGLSTSLAAQIGVAPILYFAFGQFNIFSPIINALILWTVPYIMILGSISAIIGIIFEPLGRLIVYIVYPLTWWFVGVVNIFSI